jgi:phosphatidylglycerol:prolipoprotein diacylglycerol transferase
MYPVLLKIGRFELTSYGVLVAAGYLASILWLKSRRKEMGLSEDDFWTLIYALFFGALLGAKLLYIAVTGELWTDPRYGFVFFGGLLGAMAAGEWARRKLKFSYAAMSDWFGAALPLGHSIGRVGCFLAGCCYPTQLAEAAGNFLIFLAGLRLLARPHKPGGVFLSYLLMYSAVRFVLEFWRLDDRGITVMPFSVSQWIALAVGGTASVLLWRRR